MITPEAARKLVQEAIQRNAIPSEKLNEILADIHVLITNACNESSSENYITGVDIKDCIFERQQQWNLPSLGLAVRTQLVSLGYTVSIEHTRSMFSTDNNNNNIVKYMVSWED